jgi:hypothetical protein
VDDCGRKGDPRYRLNLGPVTDIWIFRWRFRVDGSANHASLWRIGTTTLATLNATGTYYFAGSFATNSSINFTAFSNWDGDIEAVSVRELPGNHATQTTLASRPILARVPEGGRRNLLERTEEFDNNAYWVRQASVSVTPNSALAPDGSMTADLITTSGSTNRRITYTVSSIDGASSHVGSIYVKSVSGPASFEVGLGSLTTETITTDWQRIDTNVLSAGATSTTFELRFVDGSEVLIWGAQLETGSTATAYQKVVDQYDITEAGVTSLDYLSFDGSDDGMVVPELKASAGPVNIFTAFETNTDGTYEYIIDIQTGRIIVAARVESGNSGILFGGWKQVATSLNTPYVLTGIFETSGSMRLDGIEETTFSGTEVAMSGGIAIGKNGTSASSYLDGNLYGLIVRGATSTTDEITNTEAYLATRSGVTL